jgi:peroxiredoxin
MQQKMNRIGWLLLVMAVTVIACGRKPKGNFIVTVTYKNAGKLGARAGDSMPAPSTPAIVLEEVPFGSDAHPVLLDSSVLKGEEGTITLKGNGREEGVYLVVIQNGPLVLLVNDADKINIDIDLARRDNFYTVSGSDVSSSLQDFITQYDQKAAVISQAFADMDSLKQFGGTDSLLIEATNRKNGAMSGLNSYLEEVLSRTSDPALSLFVLTISSRSFQADEFEKALAATSKKFPEYKTLALLKSKYEMEQQVLAKNKVQQASGWVGQQVPDFALPSTDGTTVSVSSFRGKYLLIDFWASWCGPCRQENPNVLKAWNTFKGKNFAILGVSLDNQKAPWLNAIKEDGLPWTQISDLQMWSSKAVSVFKFDAIPYNLLVDPQGKVIGEALRGEDLENKLKQVLQ